MDNDIEASKPKKSQKRRDRQERKAERRRQREAVREGTVSKKQTFKPVKARLSKKSLPGFLAKNAEVIKQWLKDYQILFVMADDYGFQNLDRLPDQRRQQLVQNYVDVGNFILTLDAIIAESLVQVPEPQISVENTQTEQI